jgi:hypothetical protein
VPRPTYSKLQDVDSGVYVPVFHVAVADPDLPVPSPPAI